MSNLPNAPGLTLLGGATPRPGGYAPELLEFFPNPHPQADYMVSFRCPEFTALCPQTGQPDFATILLNYVPGPRLVESKSLKLYLFSFRNHGGFHEDCVNRILRDLQSRMAPRYIEVKGLFTPRGGIAIYPFASHGEGEYAEMARRRLFESAALL